MGGRGTRSYSDRRQSRWSSGLGTKVDATLKEALGAKGSPMSVSEAASGANPLFSREYSEYSENCQRAVVAYELRRRGYDVVAQPTYRGDTMGAIVHSQNGVNYSRWSGAFQNAKVENVGAANGNRLISNIDSKMGSYGDGSRAVLQVQWKSGGGHVFNVERQNGKNVYIDPQVNRRYTENYIKQNVKPGSVNIVRTDNLRVSERAKNSVTSRKY